MRGDTEGFYDRPSQCLFLWRKREEVPVKHPAATLKAAKF